MIVALHIRLPPAVLSPRIEVPDSVSYRSGLAKSQAGELDVRASVACLGFLQEGAASMTGVAWKWSVGGEGLPGSL
jgi:hypothetical protein